MPCNSFHINHLIYLPYFMVLLLTLSTSDTSKVFTLHPPFLLFSQPVSYYSFHHKTHIPLRVPPKSVKLTTASSLIFIPYRSENIHPFPSYLIIFIHKHVPILIFNNHYSYWPSTLYTSFQNNFLLPFGSTFSCLPKTFIYFFASFNSLFEFIIHLTIYIHTLLSPINHSQGESGESSRFHSKLFFSSSLHHLFLCHLFPTLALPHTSLALLTTNSLNFSPLISSLFIDT